jgi:hypothetical protein
MAWGGGGREGGPVIGWLRIKRSLQSYGGGGETVQNVLEHNLHKKVEIKNFKLFMKLM